MEILHHSDPQLACSTLAQATASWTPGDASRRVGRLRLLALRSNRLTRDHATPAVATFTDALNEARALARVTNGQVTTAALWTDQPSHFGRLRLGSVLLHRRPFCSSDNRSRRRGLAAVWEPNRLAP